MLRVQCARLLNMLRWVRQASMHLSGRPPRRASSLRLSGRPLLSLTRPRLMSRGPARSVTRVRVGVPVARLWLPAARSVAF